MAKIERKPRRNIQYKDLANAVTHHDHLEFLEDIIPKAQPYKKIKEQAAARRAKVQGPEVRRNWRARTVAAAGEWKEGTIFYSNGAGGSFARRSPGRRRTRRIPTRSWNWR